MRVLGVVFGVRAAWARPHTPGRSNTRAQQPNTTTEKRKRATHTHTHLQAAVEAVAHDELVRHAHAVRLHRVAHAVVKVAEVAVVKVGDLCVCGCHSCVWRVLS